MGFSVTIVPSKKKLYGLKKLLTDDLIAYIILYVATTQCR